MSFTAVGLDSDNNIASASVLMFLSPPPLFHLVVEVVEGHNHSSDYLPHSASASLVTKEKKEHKKDDGLV